MLIALLFSKSMIVRTTPLKLLFLALVVVLGICMTVGCTSDTATPKTTATATTAPAAGNAFALLNQSAADDRAASALLIRLQSDITVAIEALDGRLSRAASRLEATGLNDTVARAILSNLTATSPAIADSVVVSAEGILIAAEPAAYHGAEGADIRYQEHVQRILSSKRPVMSEVITVEEGFPAVVLATPIFTNESRFAGFAAVVFRPEVLIGDAAGPAVNGTPFQAMVVQTDGRVLYDTDPDQVGRMTFEDPLYADYPDLLDVARQVAAERYGAATYAFTAGGQVVQKEIAWTTIGLHGAEWRVAVIREVG